MIEISLEELVKDDSLSAVAKGARAFRVDGVSGLYVITGALDEEDQIQWAHRALANYSNAKHTNLTNLYGPQPNVWEEAIKTKDWTTLNKLRWSSLGYHYDWTQREYREDNKSIFPEDLGLLSSQLAKAVEIGRAVQQECRDRSRMPSSA
eukprot:TRINITY_DN111464_c0_g2_i2.p1 TRINITY_DN111464_c0_g2~~TRINITY_DN111464_c0_g2_i2.p1  ORF type:complete len:150 (-),score=20.27 TRINITY_DN111464_c0_g2_i2:11-460(-)